MIITKRLPKELQKDYAYRIIRDNIVKWELLPGSIISETKLADELGISRVPVREALKDLSKSKIVEIYPQRGTRIAMLDYDLVAESSFIRRVMEGAVVELACEMATEEDFDWFEEHLDLQKYYWINDTPDKLAELDREYHKRYYQIAKKMQCYELVQDMSVHLDRVRHIGYLINTDLHLVDDHRKVLEAVKRRDPEEAKSNLVRHIDRFKIDKEEVVLMAQKLIENASIKKPKTE